MDFQDTQFHVMNPVGDDRPDQQQQGFLEANILIKIGRKFDLPCVRFHKKNVPHVSTQAMHLSISTEPKVRDM